MFPMKKKSAVVGLAAGLLLATALPAYAGKPSGGGTTTTSASCSASPSPVPVGSDYAVNGSGLRASTVYGVYVTNAYGTAWVQVYTDGAGKFSAGFHAWYAGDSSVSVKGTDRKSTQAAACSFTVV